MALLIKGDRVAFATVGNPDPLKAPDIRLPTKYGIIHDPKGEKLPRCVVYFGPYKVVRGSPAITPEARKYFGKEYQPTTIKVSRPNPNPASWETVATVTHIFYVRGGLKGNAYAAGGYHHTFRGAPLTLEKSGKFYKLSLTPGRDSCIVDDRGFVFP